MSARCTGWLLREGPRPGHGITLSTARRWRAVLSVIADAANSDGEHAHPGLANMIDQSLYSRSVVLSTIKELEAAGWIVETAKCAPGRATEHRIVMDPDERRVLVQDPSQVPDQDPSDEPTGPISGANRSDSEGVQVRFPAGTPTVSTGVVTNGTAAPVPDASPLARAQALVGTTSTPATTRPRDLLWDAVMFACEIDPDTISASARGAYNRAIRDLRAINATPEQVAEKAAGWRRSWSAVTMTPTALARRWSEIPTGPPVSSSMSAIAAWAAEG